MYKRLFSLMIVLFITIDIAYAQESQWMPDPILRKAVRQRLELDVDTPLTKADMLRLGVLDRRCVGPSEDNRRDQRSNRFGVCCKA